MESVSFILVVATNTPDTIFHSPLVKSDTIPMSLMVFLPPYSYITDRVEYTSC